MTKEAPHQQVLWVLALKDLATRQFRRPYTSRSRSRLDNCFWKGISGKATRVSFKGEFPYGEQIIPTSRQPNKVPPIPMTEIEEILKVRPRQIWTLCSLHLIMFCPIGWKAPTRGTCFRLNDYAFISTNHRRLASFLHVLADP